MKEIVSNIVKMVGRIAAGMLRGVRSRSEFDRIVRSMGPFWSGVGQGGLDRELVKPGSGWRGWRQLQEKRAGVAGAHLVIEDLACQLEVFRAQLAEQAEIEMDKPNEDAYRFAGDITRRNREHQEAIEEVMRLVAEAVVRLDRAGLRIVGRWSTWPATAEAER